MKLTFFNGDFSPTTSSLETMLIEESNPLRLFAFSLHIKSSTQKISSFFEVTMKHLVSTASTDFMTNAVAVTVLKSGRRSVVSSTVSPAQL